MNSSEEKFLKGTAAQLDLNGRVLEVFLVCFATDNQNVAEKTLAKRIDWGTNAITSPQESMRPHLSDIYKRLEKSLNCPVFADSNGPGRPKKGDRSKLQHYHNWIWENKYPEYLNTTPSSKIHSHPFGDRGRIEDPDRLFGREEFLWTLVKEKHWAILSVPLWMKTKLSCS
jgi:hypothetical protein